MKSNATLFLESAAEKLNELREDLMFFEDESIDSSTDDEVQLLFLQAMAQLEVAERTMALAALKAGKQ